MSAGTSPDSEPGSPAASPPDGRAGVEGAPGSPAASTPDGRAKMEGASPAAASQGLDISGISLHIAMDTPQPQRQRTPEGDREEDDIVLGPCLALTSDRSPDGEDGAPAPSANAAGEPSSGASAADEQSMRRPVPPAIDTNTSALGKFAASQQTPNNITPSPAALRRETSALSTASSGSVLQLQVPAHRRGEMAKGEEELLAQSGGALICLYSEDMAPLVSVAHGMQLPRAQIGLLGACFTSCRSNSFELNKIHAGDSTIAYRSLFGGRILAVVILSSWGGSSGTLLDQMLRQMHDSIVAAVCLVVGEQTVVQLLEACKISQVRRVLKPASLLFQLLLTGRTQVALLTRSVGAISHLRADIALKLSRALQDACLGLSAPSPACACIMMDGKLVCATRRWFELGSGRLRADDNHDENESPRHQGTAATAIQAEKEVQLQVLLLHMFAANVPTETNVVVLPIEGLSSASVQPVRGLGESRACARHDRTAGDGTHGNAREAGREVQTGRHRLLVMGLAPVSTNVDASASQQSASNVLAPHDWRFCVLLPDDTASWTIPESETLDCIRQCLEDALYPLAIDSPDSPSSVEAQRRMLPTSSSESTPMAMPADGGGWCEALGPQAGIVATRRWWGIHPGMRRLVLVRRSQCAGEAKSCGSSAQRHASNSYGGFDLFWELEVPGDPRMKQDATSGATVRAGHEREEEEAPVRDSKKSDACVFLYVALEPHVMFRFYCVRAVCARLGVSCLCAYVLVHTRCMRALK